MLNVTKNNSDNIAKYVWLKKNEKMTTPASQTKIQKHPRKYLTGY